jgi:hypothetical protein
MTIVSTSQGLHQVVIKKLLKVKKSKMLLLGHTLRDPLGHTLRDPLGHTLRDPVRSTKLKYSMGMD